MEEDLNSTRNLGNGIFKIELNSWDEFHEQILNIIQHETYVFRGQPRKYPKNDPSYWKGLGYESLNSDLLPSFLRKFKVFELTSYSYNKYLKDHLETFRTAIKGRTDILKLLTDDEDEAWALGQHYDLETPLLDFTYSPYVAAFFALSKANSLKDDYCSVYAIAQDYINLTTEFMIYKPKTDHNQRLLSQSGLFVKFNKPAIIELEIRRTIKRECKNVYLAEIQIPTSDKERALKHLHSMNINHRTLFPDLQGSSFHANELLRKRKFDLKDSDFK